MEESIVIGFDPKKDEKTPSENSEAQIDGEFFIRQLAGRIAQKIAWDREMNARLKKASHQKKSEAS